MTDEKQEEAIAPLGIKILCGLCALIAIAVGAFGLFYLKFGVESVDIRTIVEGLLILSFSLFAFPMIYGLWTVTEWGWKVAIGWIGLGGLSHVLNWVMAEDPPLNSTIFIVVSLLALVYLYRKRRFYTDAVAG